MKKETMSTEERPSWNVEVEKNAFRRSENVRSDNWVAASGGTEEPTWSTRRGAWFVYVYNFSNGTHAWLNLSTDHVETEDPYFG